jgi:hypothetical protein
MATVEIRGVKFTENTHAASSQYQLLLPPNNFEFRYFIHRHRVIFMIHAADTQALQNVVIAHEQMDQIWRNKIAPYYVQSQIVRSYSLCIYADDAAALDAKQHILDIYEKFSNNMLAVELNYKPAFIDTKNDTPETITTSQGEQEDWSSVINRYANYMNYATNLEF